MQNVLALYKYRDFVVWCFCVSPCILHTNMAAWFLCFTMYSAY